MFFRHKTKIKQAQSKASENLQIKSNSKRRWRARKNVFTQITRIPTKERSFYSAGVDGGIALDEITSRKQLAFQTPLSRAYCIPVVRSSIKIPTEISHSFGILIPTGDRSPVLYDMLTSRNFPGLFFSWCNFNGILHVSLGNGHAG